MEPAGRNLIGPKTNLTIKHFLFALTKIILTFQKEEELAIPHYFHSLLIKFEFPQITLYSPTFLFCKTFTNNVEKSFLSQKSNLRQIEFLHTITTIVKFENDTINS